MGAGDIGIAVGDFTNAPLADFGVTVSWENVTKSTDPISGDETLSYAVAANKTAVFLKRAIDYEQSPEGLLEQGDAYLMAETGDGMAKDDKITYSGETYIIRKVIRRQPGGVTMFDFCVLKLYS